MEQLPEINCCSDTLDGILKNLKEILQDFSVTEISYLDEEYSRHHLNATHELFDKLKSIAVSQRDQVIIGFQYKRAANSKGLTSGSFQLGRDQTGSYVQIKGSTDKIRKSESYKIANTIARKKRILPNAVWNKIYAPALTILLFFFNYIRPNTLFAGTATTSFIIAAISIPSVLFFHYRPHIFFKTSILDLLGVFPGIWKTIFLSLIFIGTVWCMIQFPMWIKRDQYLVVQDFKIQQNILREALTPDLLQKFKDLEIANKLYDTAQSVDAKVIAGDGITSLLGQILNKKELLRLPIGELPYFLSSAHPMQNGNWLQEPLLLMLQGKVDNNVPSLTYKPHIDEFPKDNHFLTLSNWLDQTILKDQFGQTWSRKQLIFDSILLKENSLPDARKNSLERLKKFPDDKFEFASATGIVVTPQNTVISDSIRAISEELVRSLNKIQQSLSEAPTTTNSTP